VVNRWGRDHARSILSNHVTRVLLPGMADTELLEGFSKLIGERWVVTATVSHGPGGPSASETHRWERLAPVEELRTLPEDTAVVVYKNDPAARVSLRPTTSRASGRTLAAGSIHEGRILNTQRERADVC
jgi:type IV secretion system protein VirD4